MDKDSGDKTLDLKIRLAFQRAFEKYMSGDWSGPNGDHMHALHGWLHSWRTAELAPSEPGDDLSHVVLDSYREKVAKAIVEWDSGFFRDIAKAIERSEEEKPAVLGFVFLAMQKHLASRRPCEIEKREVRLLAKRLWAIDRLMRHEKDSGRRKRMREAMFSPGSGSGEVERAIQDKADDLHITPQGWTDLYKKAGLRDLPENRGGQPTHGR